MIDKVFKSFVSIFITVLLACSCKYSLVIDKTTTYKPCSLKDKKSKKCPHLHVKLFNEGNKDYKKGNYNAAINNYEKAINESKACGENADKIYFAKSLAHAKSGNYKDALSSLEQIDEEYNKVVIYNKAIFALNSGNYYLSIDKFNDHLNNRCGKKHECHWGIGVAYFKMKEFKKALTELKESLKFKENAEVRKVIYSIYIIQNDFKNSLKELTISKNLHPFNSSIKADYVNFLLNNDEMIKAHRASLIGINDNSLSKLISAGLNLKNGNYLNAVKKSASNDIKNVNRIEKELIVANAFLLMNELDKALNKYEEILSKHESNPLALEGIGVINYKLKKYYQAINAFEKANSKNTLFVLSEDGSIALAFSYLKTYQFKKAADSFKRVMEKNPKNALAHDGYGVSLSYYPHFIHIEELFKDANTHFDIALKQFPDDTTILAHSATTNFLLKQYDEAINKLNKAISNGANNPQLYNVLALSYMHKNRFDEAKEMIKKARLMDYRNWQYHVNSGLVETDLIDSRKKTSPIEDLITEMEAHYDNSIALGADPTAVIINKGYGFFMADKYDTALVYYNQVNDADSIVLSGRENNKAVVYAMMIEKIKSKKLFDSAKLMDGRNKLGFIDSNIEKLLYSIEQLKYTSVIYFYLPVKFDLPDIKGNLSLPQISLIVSFPEESVVIKNEKNNCDSNKKVRYQASINKTPKANKSHFRFCSSEHSM